MEIKGRTNLFKKNFVSTVYTERIIEIVNWELTTSSDRIDKDENNAKVSIIFLPDWAASLFKIIIKIDIKLPSVLHFLFVELCH